MSSIRAFIAIEIPDQLQIKLEQLTQHLKNTFNMRVVRWSPAHNIHVTLKFLGDVPTTDIDKISKLLLAEAALITPFEARIAGLGVFPSIKKPRVIWIGLDAPPVLSSLQERLEKGMAALGFAPEERAFTPHLTLGRLAQNASAGEIRQLSEILAGELAAKRQPDLGSFTANSLHLIRSDLRPDGAVYTRIASAPFATQR